MAALGLGSKTSLLLRPQADTAGGAAGTKCCSCKVSSAASLSPALKPILGGCQEKHPCCRAGNVQPQHLGPSSDNAGQLGFGVKRCGMTRRRLQHSSRLTHQPLPL